MPEIRSLKHRQVRGHSALAACLIAGDGIGPEISRVARQAVEATGAQIGWENIRVGQSAFLRRGVTATRGDAAILLASGRVLKAPLDGSHGVLAKDPSDTLNILFGVFASVRHCRNFSGNIRDWRGMDTVIIRQERWPALRMETGAVPGTGDAIATGDGPTGGNFHEWAFQTALAMGRKRVTAAHRANVSRADAAWLKRAELTARRFDGIEFEDALVDHLILQMIRSPWRYDVIMVPAREGNTVGNLCVGMAGGLGFVPEKMVGSRGTIYTTVHGTAVKLAGLDRANPCALMLAAADLLNDLGRPESAEKLVNSLRETLSAGVHTSDACFSGVRCPSVGTKRFAQEVIGRIAGGKRPGTIRKQ